MTEQLKNGLLALATLSPEDQVRYFQQIREELEERGVDMRVLHEFFCDLHDALVECMKTLPP